MSTTTKTYGRIELSSDKATWEITTAEPHVCIKLKSIFPKIPKHKIPPFTFVNNPETCCDLKWFMSRYQMEISDEHYKKLLAGDRKFNKTSVELEKIFLPEYIPKEILLNPGEKARDYQLRAVEFHQKTKRFLLADDMGLGKTLSSILTLCNGDDKTPAVVVVQTHLTKQWEAEIKRFTNLRTHIIKGTKAYSLPEADVYIIKYTCLFGWVNLFQEGYFKSVIFDEIQELRHDSSLKYKSAAAVLSNHVGYAIGLSATPIFNYADELFNILDLLKPHSLGSFEDFSREWSTARDNKTIIKDPKALGTYLREINLFLRRTRAEVGYELPRVNTIIHTVGYNENDVKTADDLAIQLSIKVVHGSFMERGLAARELDLLIRRTTGISKAREVAQYVRILLENDEAVVLAGWHRSVYDIWKDELKEFNPVFYTGEETPAQKAKSKEDFISGKTKLFIISLRSAVGLDGLQKVCSMVVVGELDHSPQVHNQLVGRVDRPGQESRVTAVYLVSNYGSDPGMIENLGLKSYQAYSIIDPLEAPPEQYSDNSRIQKMALSYLEKVKGRKITNVHTLTLVSSE